MTGNNEIIQKILSDAKSQADEIVNVAENRAAEVLSRAKKESDDILSAAQKSASAEAEEMLKRRCAVADLDVKRRTLGRMSEIMESVGTGAIKKIRSLPSDKYKALIAEMILNNAEDGDIIVICKEDKDIITPDFVKDIAAKKKISLELSKDYGEFLGGVILKSKNIDKNLALEEELASIKKEIEPELATLLFGRKQNV